MYGLCLKSRGCNTAKWKRVSTGGALETANDKVVIMAQKNEIT